jgi:hypothetical protein
MAADIEQPMVGFPEDPPQVLEPLQTAQMPNSLSDSAKDAH